MNIGSYGDKRVHRKSAVIIAMHLTCASLAGVEKENFLNFINSNLA